MAEAKNGWSEHVVKDEHLFLRNICSNEEMKKIDIVDVKSYKEIVYRLFDLHSYFEVTLQDGVITDEIRDFMLEDLSGCYETFQELRKDIENIAIPKRSWNRKSSNFSEKIIAFLYSNMISFGRTEKLKGIPLSKKSLIALKIIWKIHIVFITHTFLATS